LARLFATKYPVIGFDINQKRVDELNAGRDHTLEVEDHILQSVLVKENPFVFIQKDRLVMAGGVTPHESNNTSSNQPTQDEASVLYCSSDPADIDDATIYIITVPTPIEKHHRPDLTPLKKASQTVGKVLKKEDVVIYESTVFPGATEEVCVPE